MKSKKEEKPNDKCAESQLRVTSRFFKSTNNRLFFSIDFSSAFVFRVFQIVGITGMSGVYGEDTDLERIDLEMRLEKIRQVKRRGKFGTWRIENSSFLGSNTELSWFFESSCTDNEISPRAENLIK